MSELQKQLDKMAWSVPEGWIPERLGQCSRCHDRVLYCATPAGARLRFDSHGKDHFYVCTNAPRVGVGRKWRGQRTGGTKWDVG